MQWKILLLSLLFSSMLFSQGKRKKEKKKSDWINREYSGERNEKDLKAAMASKAFSWLSGSPADNEKLSVGKTAQFFGFVALRHESGRAIQRGSIGRAFYEIASPQQREIILKAVMAEEKSIKDWWTCRSQILRILEDLLHNGKAIDIKRISSLAEEFGWLNSLSAYYEAKAFAAVEDTLTKSQWQKLRSWRNDPDLVNSGTNSRKIKNIKELNREQAAQYEDLFAKCFSWLTGTMTNNKIIPLGQPAQFFGFVAIRHKSGHGASRGRISKEFLGILNKTQKAILDESLKDLVTLNNAFTIKRNFLLNELAKLRTNPTAFSLTLYKKVSKEIGIIEIKYAQVEAQAYQKIYTSMSEEQKKEMMNIRSDYIIDKSQMDILDISQRGAKLFNLCSACHNKIIAPSLNGVFDREIASLKNYDYSSAMKKFAENKKWNEANLDQYLNSPMKVVPGTKMAFQGLLNKDDRTAVIEYLKKLK